MRYLLSLLVVILNIASLYSSDLITNRDRLADMDSMFVKQKELGKNREKVLFGIFSDNLSIDEEQALKFLYSYMPLSDMADLDGNYFKESVKTTLLARNELPWGKKIPEDIFLHFVLPLRVNNENLDEFRIKMYTEIKERVKNLSLHDAALEINHWCHEKVTYRPSDERTISPLDAIKCSFGRCGEESTLLVSALRTAGIPARQVYVPRWTHSDDNHAWVEVWVDGKWYFMGACEPAPELNMGWFAVPATRAMLVHTRVYGKYFGNEEVLNNEAKFAELNLISNYAPSKKFYVKVEVFSIGTKLHNEPGYEPVRNANVEYRIYNYAEYYPLAKTKTDSNGITSFTSGLGNILVWAYLGNGFGYQMIKVSETDTVTIRLKNFGGNDISKNHHHEDFDFIAPPPGNAQVVAPGNEQLNAKRLLYEDSVRTAYMKSFKDSAWAAKFADENKIDKEKIIEIFKNCEGNWKEIAAFIELYPLDVEKKAIELLKAISIKDLKDTKSSILDDFMVGVREIFHRKYPYDGWPKNYLDVISVDNLLNGRVANEKLVDYKQYLLDTLNFNYYSSFDSTVYDIKNWIKENIKVDNINNLHSRAPLTPRGVFDLRDADSKSIDIFFVAACRTFGVAARLNPETRIPQYFDGNNWINVSLNDKKEIATRKGFVHLINKTIRFMPRYAKNFSICAFKDGAYSQLDFDEDKKLSDFPENLELDYGEYILVTGNRMDDGSVLSTMDFFKVSDHIENVIVKVRANKLEEKMYGKIDLNSFNLENYSDKKMIKLTDLSKEKGSMLIFIDPDKEPTKHVMNDIPPYSDIFNKWQGGIAFVLSKEKTSTSFTPNNYSKMPKQSIFAYDVENKLIKSLEQSTGKQLSADYPVIIIFDKTGKIIYLTTGYCIGTGEQLSREISVMK